MKAKAQIWTFGLVLIYFCCYFLQVYRFPDILMLGIGAVFCLLFLLKQKRIRISLGLILLAVTMFSFCIIQFGIEAIFAKMIYIVLLMWILADYLGIELQTISQGEEKLLYVLYSMILGHLIYGVLNSYMYFAGTGVPGTRYWFDIWSQQLTPGTQLTMYFITVFAAFFPAIICLFRRKWENVIIIIGTMFLIPATITTPITKSVIPICLADIFCFRFFFSNPRYKKN